MSKFKNLVKTIKEVKKEQDTDLLIPANFQKEFLETLERIEQKQTVPTDYYRPSSISGCKRMLYAMRKGIEAIEKSDPILIGICESGTDRHERIQTVVQNMEGAEWLDVEKEIEKAKLMGINSEFVSWDASRTEARCKNEDLRIYFQCDGIIRYMNKKMLLEIKTESGFKWAKRTEPEHNHKLQATCYGMGLGIDYILYVYENRDFTTKKIYLFKLTNELKNEVSDKIAYVDNCVENNIIPPKETDKCQYCKYTKWCEEIGE